MFALHRERIGAPWKTVRKDCDPKERYCEGLLDELGREGPGGGRMKAMRALSGSNWSALLKLCPEIAGLQERVAGWFTRHQG